MDHHAQPGYHLIVHNTTNTAHNIIYATPPPLPPHTHIHITYDVPGCVYGSPSINTGLINPPFSLLPIILDAIVVYTGAIRLGEGGGDFTRLVRLCKKVPKINLTIFKWH